MTKSLRILLVEDDADSRYVLSRLLGREGHVVEAAPDAAAALDLAARQPFDVLLSDIGLPGMDGCALMTAVGRLYRIPGVALTGFADAKQESRCRSAGFAAFLAKPVSVHEVLDAVARAANADADASPPP